MTRNLLAAALASGTVVFAMAPAPAAAQVSAQCPNMPNMQRQWTGSRLRCYTETVQTAQTICPVTHPNYILISNGRDYCGPLNILVPAPSQRASIGCQGIGFTSANIVNDAGAGTRDLCRRQQRNYVPPVIVP